MGIKQTARYATCLALINVENGMHSNDALSQQLQEIELSAEDRAFATRIFYGVLERKNTLDFYLAPYLRRTPDIEVMIILRMVVYQIRYMNVPDAVALDQGVRLCPAVKKSSAKGFVNGSIRGYLREPQPKGFSFIQPLSRQLSIEYSCDEGLAQNLIEDWGEERAREILKSSLDRSPIYIRVNTKKTSPEEVINSLKNENIEPEKTFLPNALRIRGNVPIERLETFQKGWFHVQDLSSQLCCEAVTYGFTKGTVLDLCAAPGGKSFTICEEMLDEGIVKSFDLSENRLSRIVDGKTRLGLQSLQIAVGDASEYCENLKGADRVLCDVPCSGFGVIAKKPEIKYKKKENYASLPDIQLKILENASRYVKEDGILIYSTCTVMKSENENVVDLFLKRHTEYAPHTLAPVFNSVKNPEKGYMATIFPNDFESDGFFVATFRRKTKNE